jgi:cellulose synthase (UDP-forming)
MLLTEVLYLAHRLFPFAPALLFDPRHRRQQADRLMADPLVGRLAVEVWIPVDNEPERLVRRALLTSLHLDPAPASVTLIDLLGRPEIVQLGRDLGAAVLSAAAGESRVALMNRMLAAGGAPLIAMFDGNFMPLKPFLRRTLGFFRDERVAMVQTPQRHFQSEFWNRNLGVDLVIPGNRDTFFHYLEVIRDRCNAVLGCGTSWVARRSALVGAGGFLGAAGWLEDQQTSARLLTRGWRLVYLDEILSLGEPPHTFAAYLQQRLHGVQGELQTFLMPRRLPIWRLGLWPRCFYLDQALGLLTPLLRTLYLLLPLLALMLSVPLINASLLAVIAYALPFLILYHCVPSWLSNHHFKPFWHEIHETLIAFPALARLPRMLRHPFRALPEDDPTTSERRFGQSLNLRLAWPFLLLLLLLIGTLLVHYAAAMLPGASLVPAKPYQGESANLLWNLYNGWVLLVCLLCCIDQPVRQGGDRVPLNRRGQLEIGGQPLGGHTGDMSESGVSFLIDGGGPSPGGGDGWLILEQPSLRLPVRLVRQSPCGLAGLVFRPMDPPTNLALLNLLYGGGIDLPAPRQPGGLTALRSLVGGLWQAEPILRRT